MNDFVLQLKREKQRLQSLIGSIDNLLQEYSKEFNASSKDSTLFSQNIDLVAKDQLSGKTFLIEMKKGYSLKSSVLTAINSFDRFEKSTALIPILLKWYPEKEKDILNFKSQVSGLVSDLGKSGEIVKYQYSTSKKDTVWGKPEWLDENGKPKEGFEPVLD